MMHVLQKNLFKIANSDEVAYLLKDNLHDDI